MKTLQIALGATALAISLTQASQGQQPPLPLASGQSTISVMGGRQQTWRTGKMGTRRRAGPVAQRVETPTVYGAESPAKQQGSKTDRIGTNAATLPAGSGPPSVSPKLPTPKQQRALQPVAKLITSRGSNRKPSPLRGELSRTSDPRKSFESTEPLSEPLAASSWISDEVRSEPGDDQGVVFASDLPHGVSLASTISHLPHSASLAEPVGFAVVGDVAPVQPTAWANNQATSRDQTSARGVLNDPFELPLLWGGGERIYARGEYLRWKIQGNHVPALVTSSPTGTAQNQAGVLGFGTTTILFGDSDFHAEDRAGGRLTVGYWISSDDVFGIEATYYQVKSSSASFSTSSTGDPILARPFFNVDPNVGPGQDSSILAMAGWMGTLPQFGATSVDLQGDVSVFAQNELRSGSISFRGVSMLGGQNADWRTDWLAGYRYFDFNELLVIEDTILPFSAPFISGTRLDGVDRFQAKNRFHGGELAAATRFRCGRFSGEFIGRVALGNMHEEVSISGTTTSFVPAAGGNSAQTVVVPGALLAQSSNSGVFRRDRLTVIPEVSMNLNFQVTKNVSVTGGYTLIWVNQIVRAADQIDTSLNSSMFGGAAGTGPVRPNFTFAETDLLIHGISGGVEIRY